MTIFVQLASYRDPLLVPTIRDLLAKARSPQHLRVGICHQYHPGDRFETPWGYRNDRRFRIVDVPHEASHGVCWARRQVQSLYRGERYTLQIDSHMRFARHWDEALVGMVQRLSARGSRKPLLTGYVPPFEADSPEAVDPDAPPLGMEVDGVSADGILLFRATELPRWRQLKGPVPAKFLSAGFCFTLGRFCNDVPYDADLYFHGEEISMTVRAFTHGYDLFHPHRTYLWHYYERAGLPRHWGDHKDWHRRDDRSIARVRTLLRPDPGRRRPLGKFGLGAARTLRDYEAYAGLVLG